METKTRAPGRRRRFTVEEYHRMGEAGILGQDERVELIEGEVFEMTPIGSRHYACVTELTWVLSRQLGGEFRIGVQGPVRLGEYGEPEPDVAVLRARNYAGSLPGPEDVLLLIEVSDTTVAHDREVKLPLYARAGIAETWIVDLLGEAIERHNDPAGDGYRRTERVGRGHSLASEVLPDLILHADTVLLG